MTAPVFVLAHGLADAASLGITIQPVLIGAGALVLAAAWLAPRLRVTAEAAPPPSVAEQPRRTKGRITLGVASLLLTVTVATAAFGAPDPGLNPAYRLIYVVGFSWLVAASALLGPVWTLGNPLRRISRVVARLIGDPDEELARSLPERVGLWPAVGAAVVFVGGALVLEQWALVVLITVVAYAVAQLVAASVYGGGWYARGDALDVMSRLVGALAVLGRDDDRMVRRRAADGIAATPAPAGFLAFVSVLIGAALLHAVGPAPTVGARVLQLALCIGIALTASVTATLSTPFAPALIGVLAGHLGAWLWAALLVDAPYAIVLLSDPLARGWNLFGLTGVEPPANLIPIVPALIIQLVLFLGGHVLAVLAADLIARRTVPLERRSAAQFAFRAMVLLSALAGVWLRLA